MKNYKLYEEFLNESIHDSKWLKAPVEKFLRDLDAYIRKETNGKWEILRKDEDGVEHSSILTNGPVMKHIRTYLFNDHALRDKNDIDMNNSLFLDIIERKLFRVEIMPVLALHRISDFFNITYKSQGDKYVPSFESNRTFHPSHSRNNRLQKSEVTKLYGESVWFLTGGLHSPKRLKEEYDNIIKILENAPILDLTEYRGRISGNKYGL